MMYHHSFVVDITRNAVITHQVIWHQSWSGEWSDQDSGRDGDGCSSVVTRRQSALASRHSPLVSRDSVEWVTRSSSRLTDSHNNESHRVTYDRDYLSACRSTDRPSSDRRRPTPIDAPTPSSRGHDARTVTVTVYRVPYRSFRLDMDVLRAERRIRN